MHRPKPFAPIAVLALAALAPQPPALGAGLASPPSGSGTASLSVVVEGSVAQVELIAPAATLVGFDRAPRTAAERETLAMAAENLKTGDALVRFNAQAGCRLAQARADVSPAPAPARGEPEGRLGASWRFECERPDLLDSAALGLFVGFPALTRLQVRYATAAGRGETTATQGHPVVSFVPLVR